MTDSVKPLPYTREELDDLWTDVSQYAPVGGFQYGNSIVRRLIQTAKAGMEEDAVKAGMVRRMNAMHAALTEIMDAVTNDPFNSRIRYNLTQPEGAWLDGEHMSGRLTFGMLKRAQHALSQDAYAISGTQSSGQGRKDGGKNA